MLAAFLIMLREGIEAALIVGIIAGYLARTGRSEWVPAVWVGTLLAVALSLFVGAGILALGREFPQKTQEAFEAIVGALAVVILISMVFWMRKAGRSIKATMQHDVEVAFHDRRGPTWALIGMSFFAVAREGLESVFFLLAIFQQSPGAAAPLGALLGVACSAVLGWGIYRGGLHLDLRRFFRWTGVFIIFVAAGLAADGAAQPARGGDVEPPAGAGLGHDPRAAGQLGPRHAALRPLRLSRRAGGGRAAGLGAGARDHPLALPAAAAGAGRPPGPARRLRWPWKRPDHCRCAAPG